MIDDPPTWTKRMHREAQDVKHAADPQDLWGTHVLVCAECGCLQTTAPAGAKRDILDDGLPVAETCRDCETTRRHYDVKGLKRRQS
jgi:hypothetical protein